MSEVFFYYSGKLIYKNKCEFDKGSCFFIHHVVQNKCACECVGKKTKVFIPRLRKFVKGFTHPSLVCPGCSLYSNGK